MATLYTRKAGKVPGYEIRFFDPHGHRLIIYLGGRKYSEGTANELKKIVEKLIYYQTNDEVPDKKTVAWLESASPEIKRKLADAGLINVPETHTLKDVWTKFLEMKELDRKTGKIKEATISQYYHAKRRFFEFFKEADCLADLSKESLMKWKAALLKRLKPATVASTLKHCKSVFTWAVEQGWIEESPLDGIGRGSFVNRSRDRIISMEEYHRLLDACPCQDWRVIITLARIGGLRCPSEVVALKWEDVNWERNCFFVRSPKTEHHEGKESRIVPIFPELKTELETLFFMPESEGKEFVINRYRDPQQNLGTTFAKIVKRAGLLEIPRPFDNMRMTRSNEVYNKWGAFKESQWIGHTGRVRQDHYLMIQDSDYEEAARWKIPPQKSATFKEGSQNNTEKTRPRSVCIG
ncbi:MAG: site-specific integrase [Planctomycetaceae bacterium]|nr:site-specific integrase [Planctomycetaceae bacterium]